jgi:hypothetical protein
MANPSCEMIDTEKFFVAIKIAYKRSLDREKA